ncbi:MAG: Rad52/Rad22 family DNA repair protein [Xanthobacteraceae bacterium]|uniref:Rad52/Rad22 family DNA repair protein n=1 Tax=Pseudolabrys sp. TaxID=1960880 RepID=UPI003D0FC74D
MSFTIKQRQALRRKLDQSRVRTRETNGRQLSYIEGWYAISEANRIFGFDGWSRETLESKCVLARENRGMFTAVYTAKARITVWADGTAIIRDGHGTGEGWGNTAGEVHDTALKAAETDATKRALATFGSRFGLALYDRSSARSESQPSNQSATFNFQYAAARPRSQEANKENCAILPLGEAGRIDKSLLTIAAPKRIRNRAHLRYVATRPCLICGRHPSDAHHLKFAQPKALGLKVSDEYTVPLCRGHHRELHRFGNERNWWQIQKIDALAVAHELWTRTRQNLDLGKDASN